MKTIVVISGKGGTGKTSLTASFAMLAKNIVLADCDVDAADLHLLLSPNVIEEQIFRSGEIATIDKELCTDCGACCDACVFSAIDDSNTIDPIACEGCATCALVCSSNAIVMHPAECGRWFISETRLGPMVHAKLDPGKENSGRLVSLVRTKAQELAEQQKRQLVLIDGPPGIGCSVIASIAGTDLAVIITEPTMSGLHDLERATKLTRHFQINTAAIINKSDINDDMSGEIEDLCNKLGVKVIGRIPYSTDFVKAQLIGKSIIEYNDDAVSRQIRDIWKEIEGHI
ncbi:MAG: P-loop NTPase [Deltaproteobacteria bacterium]|jgi:MinD superfamily P-loop ATPase|nr:P-loop NTPase [Deltaproteobacteria bacterium]